MGDLKELTFSSKRSLSPNPQRRKLQYQSGSTEDLHEEERDEKMLTLHIVPSTPTGPHEDDLQSPLDYPHSALLVDSPLESILQALLDKR